MQEKDEEIKCRENIDRDENEEDDNGGNAKTSLEHKWTSRKERLSRTKGRDGNREEEEEEKKRIQWNGGRNTVLFPSNNPEMSHHEWAARSPALQFYHHWMTQSNDRLEKTCEKCIGNSRSNRL